MATSVSFYGALGFELTYGGVEAAFSSLRFGQCFVNLALREIETPVPWWGRVIFHVPNVDAVYHKAMASGFDVEAPPRDASWGERFFHVTDPAGHQLSFAKPL
jgi:catechol 2,3-dioxygenase-like lactoylglutathione lyase family enzyme